MWKWLKSLFTKDKKVSPDIKYLNLTKGDLKKLKAQEDPHVEMYQTNEYRVEELQKMTKGDLKRLKAQGKIKSIAYPFY